MSFIIAGFLLGLSLIAAVGPQNAYIIKMGVKRDHIGPIVLACFLSDVILINAGIAGVGVLVEKFPTALIAMKYLGAAYLLYFAFTCFRDALSKRQEVITVSEETPRTTASEAAPGAVATLTRVQAKETRVGVKEPRTWVAPVMGAMALTWLNPLAYVDVLVMLGGIANSYGDGRWLFGLGALGASALWFPTVGFGAAKLSPILARPQTWRVINTVIGLLMIALTIKLLTH